MNINAETTVIDGVEYQNIYLTGDSATNISKINECNKNGSGNYRYVMTADWNLENGTYNTVIAGGHVIWDLHGYTLSAYGWDADTSKAAYITAWPTTFELADSSETRTGVAKTKQACFFIMTEYVQTVTFSGGTYYGHFDFHRGTHHVIFRGGSVLGLINAFQNAEYTVDVPWYYQSAYNDSGLIRMAKAYNEYTISTSAIISGEFNDVLSHKFGLTAAELTDLVMPSDQTYYLYGRDGDAKYAFLKIMYDSSAKKWVKVDAE